VSEPKHAETVFEGKQFSVVREEWERPREIVRHRGSTTVVPVHEGSLVLVEIFREPVRRRLIELPAGTLEVGEEPLASAQRELEEEVGLKGGRWTSLGSYLTSPGFLDERMHVFLAEDLERGEQNLDPGEQITVVRWPVDDVESRLADVEDLKTLAGLLLFLRGR
jgi:ADP-ribose pyrophosphatase